MRLLNLLWPDMQDEFADAIHDLADYLGDAHDLAEFYDVISSDVEVPDDGETLQALIGLANRWRRKLEMKARP